jgi:hypothetical protein
MIITLILVFLALLALALILWTLYKTDESGNEEEIRPLDLEAFLNLVDQDEERFLRANLSAREFRKIQRERLRAAAEYVGGVSHNAATMLRIGAAARRSADAQVSEAGQRLIDSASRLRFRALLAKSRLYLGVALPGVPLNPAGVVEGYRQISDLAAQLGRLECPVTGPVTSKAV